MFVGVSINVRDVATPLLQKHGLLKSAEKEKEKEKEEGQLQLMLMLL